MFLKRGEEGCVFEKRGGRVCFRKEGRKGVFLKRGVEWCVFEKKKGRKGVFLKRRGGRVRF